MSKLLKYFIFIILIAGIVLTCYFTDFSEITKHDEYLVKVNDIQITRKDVLTAISRALPEYNPEKDTGKVFRTYLKMCIEDAILLHYSKDFGIEVSDEELKKVILSYFFRFSEDESLYYDVEFREKLRKDLLLLKTKAQICRRCPEPTDAELFNYYTQHQVAFTVPEKLVFYRIMVHDKKQADLIERWLRWGHDFEKLARKHSLGPEAALGGKLEGMTAEHIKRLPFGEKLLNLKPGERTSVIETYSGYQIFLYERKMSKYLKSLNEVRPQIATILTETKQAKYYEKWLKDARHASKIEYSKEGLQYAS